LSNYIKGIKTKKTHVNVVFSSPPSPKFSFLHGSNTEDMKLLSVSLVLVHWIDSIHVHHAFVDIYCQCNLSKKKKMELQLNWG